MCLPPVALVFPADFDYMLVVESKSISKRSPDFRNGFFDKSVSLIRPFHFSLELVSVQFSLQQTDNFNLSQKSIKNDMGKTNI
jgi:hypothetical protein